MIKLVTLTTDPEELKPMLGLLRRLYFGRRVEALSLLWDEREWELDANPVVQRYYSEYNTLERPQEIGRAQTWLQEAIRRVILEERPDVLVVPDQNSDHYVFALELAERRGCKTLLWPATPYADEGSLKAERVGLLSPLEVPAAETERAFTDWDSLLDWISSPGTPTVAAHPVGGVPNALAKLKARKELEGARLFELARSDDPRHTLREAFQSSPGPVDFIETVNVALEPGHHRFCYGVYDNEFALTKADFDLKQLCSELDLPFTAEIVNPASGSAHGDGPPEAPAGPTLLRLTLSREPLATEPWHQKYHLPSARKLKIVLADSMNMAGSLANHCLTINRYTQHQATGLCTEEHPWISYPQEECRLQHLSAEPEPEVIQALEQADGFIFFEDDDETSPSFPFDLRPYVHGKPVVHVYIGYRIHKKVAPMQRPGRTVLTPLPHIMRMVPGAHFYAGFPPASLYDVPLEPPRSDRDGVLRVLQTPSMPHRILSRFVYHKDTESFLAASRALKERYPEVEFLQLGGLPHAQILRARQLCDITVNHLRGYISLSGDEALYFKRPLVHAFDQFSVNRHKEYWGLDTPFPWLTATPHTLPEVLARLIEEPDLRAELGEAGHRFIQDYFAPELGILPLIWHLAHAPEASCV